MNPAEPISLSICDQKTQTKKKRPRRGIQTHLPGSHDLREHIENEMDDPSM